MFYSIITYFISYSYVLGSLNNECSFEFWKTIFKTELNVFFFFLGVNVTKLNKPALLLGKIILVQILQHRGATVIFFMSKPLMIYFSCQMKSIWHKRLILKIIVSILNSCKLYKRKLLDYNFRQNNIICCYFKWLKRNFFLILPTYIF